ncbi:classical arabinogalactan protein 6 [Ricinus communis]|uniref:classical arabinogalactan protein 6 n=1 Tax=Ricinus communis TaxID=3988 RepID=UPI00201A8F91|nr:classical arabinogalactan protein 6 [Ricinus communis]
MARQVLALALIFVAVIGAFAADEPAATPSAGTPEASASAPSTNYLGSLAEGAGIDPSTISLPPTSFSDGSAPSPTAGTAGNAPSDAPSVSKSTWGLF